MLQQIGIVLARYLRRLIPDSFVFALILTLLVGGLAWAFADAGPKETSAVVVERLYRACSFAGSPAGAIEAISSTLAARVERYRNGATLADFAEPPAFNYLNKARPTQAQSCR